MTELSRRSFLAAPVLAREGELEDCFRLSRQIIDRAEEIRSRTGKAGIDALYRIVLDREIAFLQRYLSEEVEVARSRVRRRAKVIDVTRKGLRGDGRSDNHPPLCRLLEEIRPLEPGAVLRFPAGVYRFSSEATVRLDRLHGVSLEGEEGTVFLIDGTRTPCSLSITRCRDVQIRRIAFDMDPPPFTSGAVTEVEPEKCTFVIEQDAKARAADDPVFLESGILRGKCHDSRTGRILSQAGDPRIVRIEALGGRRYRLHAAAVDLTTPAGLTAGIQPGMLFSLHARSDKGRGNGIEILSSEHVLFRHVRLHGVAAHCAVARDSAGIQFLDCAFEPAAGRLALNTADGFHFPGNRKGPYLERCRVDRTNDDCMNFYTRAAAVLDVTGPNRLLSAQGATYHAGDLAALVNTNNGQVDALLTVASERTSEWRGQPCAEVVFGEAFGGGIHTRTSTGRGPVHSREYTPSGGKTYHAAMAMDAPFEHLLVNLSAKNDGFIIRNCDMGWNRGSGFKCKASNGVVENWRMHSPSMGVALYLRVELDWREAFFPHNIVFRQCRLGGSNPVVVGGALPRVKKLERQAMPWMRDIELSLCTDGAGEKPLDFRI